MPDWYSRSRKQADTTWQLFAGCVWPGIGRNRCRVSGGALVSQFIIDRRSVLHSSLVGTAPRESGTPIFALYGFPALGSIHLASPTPSSLASCYTTIATSPSPMQAVFHPVEKETEMSIRRSSRVALRGLIGAAS